MRNHLVAGAAALGAILLWWTAFAALTLPLGTSPILALPWWGGALVAGVWAYRKVLRSRREKAPDGIKATP